VLIDFLSLCKKLENVCMEKMEHPNKKHQSARFYVGMLILLMVLGRWGWVSIKHATVRRVAEELNTPGNFWGAPVSNHANTAFIFGERSEIGINIYLSNARSNKISIGSLVAGNFNVTTLRLLAWSPDDNFCTYTHDGGLFIYNGNSGQQLAALGIGGDIANFAWLSNSQFVTFIGLNLIEVSNQQNVWTLNHIFTLTNDQTVSALASLTDHSIVWRQNQQIWSYNFNDRIPQKIWEANTNTLVDFTITESTSELLLNLGVKGGSLFKLNPFYRIQMHSDFAPVQKLDGIQNTNDYVFEISSINDGKGQVYLSADTGERYTPAVTAYSAIKDKTLFVRRDSQSEPMQVLGKREVVDYSISHDRIYIMGSLTNEPCRIWEYNINSDSLTCIYSSLSPFKHATLVASQFYVITNQQDKITTYRLWSPPNIVPSQKYPVMIGQTVYKWQAEPQIAANCGYYFALASRPIWTSPKIENWADDVMNVYNDLAKNPNVDTNRVFLYGVSAEGGGLENLVEMKPELWKGAFLEGATGPILSSTNGDRLSISIVVGNDDQELSSVEKYMDLMAKNGHLVQVVHQEGAHNWLSAATLRASARSLAEFLSENN